MQCPCGTGLEFKVCCEPYLLGTEPAPTAEALMRSRYTAFALQDLKYIKKTLAPESQKDFDLSATTEWSSQSQWKGLKILSVKQGQSEDKKGTVEFIATYSQGGETFDHHEVSTFKRGRNGEWLFVDGESHTHKEGEDPHSHGPKPETIVRSAPKIGRNDPCECGSGKKYKKCCGAEISK